MGIAVSCSPQNSMQLMGFRAGSHRQKQRSRTCRQRIASQAFRHRAAAEETGRDLLTSACPQDPQLRVPCAEHRLRARYCATGNSQSQSDLRLGEQIFFLAAATSQTTTAEKSGPARLGHPVPGRGDVEGHNGTALLRTPSPCLPAQAAHIPHPTSHHRRSGSGLACCAQPAVPSLVCVAPAWSAQPQPAQPGPCSSLFIYPASIPLCSFMPAIWLFLSLIPSLSTFLTTHQ